MVFRRIALNALLCKLTKGFKVLALAQCRSVVNDGLKRERQTDKQTDRQTETEKVLGDIDCMYPCTTSIPVGHLA